ncbi:hypothetical protein FGE12_05000 [Aggregicoccus sp. 17bor-14]|uniref:hypothetical protein n=1 Tax=Myxococcaceae TaxID=31 RepID=UPI00129CA3FE|nr:MULTISPECIES: hypothetical protein [Myxococcaceae]MBF5041738.1 hypothetical protein [Simulacricoccus sp. 17bor-14]MRI87519.1 hypothetical protein [Aggregicoccus sp. 17bor-14]
MKTVLPALALLALCACTSVEVTTVKADDLTAQSGAPKAVIQANALGLTALFHMVDLVPSNLDIVVNKMLVAEAKAMGAKKVELKSAHTTPRHGLYALTGFIIGFTSSSAVGVAVE